MNHAPGVELLDDPAAEPAAVRVSLGNIARSNRIFGGTAAVLYGLDRLLAQAPRDRVRSMPRAEARGARSEVRGADARRSPSDAGRSLTGSPDFALRTSHFELSLLDLGTGAGDIPRAVRRWGAARGTPICTFGLERLRAAATLARGADLPVVLGCAGTLPFATASVDVITISQLLHHCDPGSAVTLLREAARVARRGVVVADLLRSTTAAALFGLAARLLGFDRYTREDGMTSVSRGYAEEELRTLCERAGLVMDVTVRPGWRIVAWGAAR